MTGGVPHYGRLVTWKDILHQGRGPTVSFTVHQTRPDTASATKFKIRASWTKPEDVNQKYVMYSEKRAFDLSPLCSQSDSFFTATYSNIHQISKQACTA
jgi:hypothetical protein